MSIGISWIRKTCCTINWAISLADGNLGRGMKCVTLKNLSLTVKMVVFPFDVGRQ
jgi:hypothetical protein